MRKIIDDPLGKYVFERINRSSGSEYSFDTEDNVRTFFIHEGRATFKSKSKEGTVDEILLGSEEGIIIGPNLEYTLSTNSGYIGFQNTSPLNGRDPVQIFDDGIFKKEVPVGKYSEIKGIKKVVKPWGHELWITWLKDHHVMKQIAMNPGYKSSLQFHRQKLETNAIQTGSATVLDLPEIDPNTTEEEVQKYLESIGDLSQYMREMKPPLDMWTSIPGHIHRVISGPEGYLAYEVSTPELDDVIRLQDDTGRGSGRIIQEHLQGENPGR